MRSISPAVSLLATVTICDCSDMAMETVAAAPSCNEAAVVPSPLSSRIPTIDSELDHLVKDFNV